MGDNSPSSLTADSSDGRLPVTPRDGGEILIEQGRGVREKQQTFHATEQFGTGDDGLPSASDSEIGLEAKKLARRASTGYDDFVGGYGVSYDDFVGGDGVSYDYFVGGDRESVSYDDFVGGGRESVSYDDFVRGGSGVRESVSYDGFINGSIKLDDDDDDDDFINGNIKLGGDDDDGPTTRANPPMSMMDHMGMGMGMPQRDTPMMMGNPWMTQADPMLQQFMFPPPQGTDPQLLAAQQHAMMAARQAYQLAVAQQAMQAAGDEWERGSTLGWPSSVSTVMFPARPRSMYCPQQTLQTRQPRLRVKSEVDLRDRPSETLMQQDQKGRSRTLPPPSIRKRNVKA